jgi:crotonobetainyl-CoA:carnitine CoA-transferase CaiB-like acyl-CoA transferase
MRRIIASITLLVLTLLPGTALAYESNICGSATCTADEVGIIMEGISDECGNSGTCELTDIMTVFANIGNWISGIIGGIVLMMYVIGGLYFLTSGGNQQRIQKGKDYMRISTIGMLIVMFAYLGIYALRGVLRFGDATAYEDGYVTCVNEETEGQTCDLNSTCVDGACLTECEQQYGDKGNFDSSTNTYYRYQCVDKTTTDDTKGCIANLCPGDENWQCCQAPYILRGVEYNQL